MKILLRGASGGIGSAIKEFLKEHEINTIEMEVDWVIFAQGVMSEEDVEDTFRVNTFHCIQTTQDFLPITKYGFIYISSTAALGGNSKYPVYSASKAALNVYAKAMQKAHPELQFYALCPGPTNTAMWRGLGLEGVAQEPVEVAKAVQRIMAGEFKGNVIVTVRNGEVNFV